MKTIVLLILVFISFGLATLTLSGEQKRAEDNGIRGNFMGAWRLVSFEAPSPDGKIHKADSTGMFVFTREGHASVVPIGTKSTA